jgi:hypothetical protein
VISKKATWFKAPKSRGQAIIIAVYMASK